MKKKLMFLLTDTGDASQICMDLSGVMQWIEGDLDGVPENDMQEFEYTIKPVMMTQDEIDNLPEADI